MMMMTPVASTRCTCRRRISWCAVAEHLVFNQNRPKHISIPTLRVVKMKQNLFFVALLFLNVNMFGLANLIPDPIPALESGNNCTHPSWLTGSSFNSLLCAYCDADLVGIWNLLSDSSSENLAFPEIEIQIQIGKGPQMVEPNKWQWKVVINTRDQLMEGTMITDTSKHVLFFDYLDQEEWSKIFTPNTDLNYEVVGNEEHRFLHLHIFGHNFRFSPNHQPWPVPTTHNEDNESYEGATNPYEWHLFTFFFQL